MGSGLALVTLLLRVARLGVARLRVAGLRVVRVPLRGGLGLVPRVALLGGLVLAGRPGPQADTRAYALAASAVTLSCGLVGCLFAGLGGLTGLALGLTLGALPVLVLRRA